MSTLHKQIILATLIGIGFSTTLYAKDDLNQTKKNIETKEDWDEVKNNKSKQDSLIVAFAIVNQAKSGEYGIVDTQGKELKGGIIISSSIKVMEIIFDINIQSEFIVKLNGKDYQAIK